MNPTLAVGLLALLVGFAHAAERPVYYLNTNWVPQVQGQIVVSSNVITGTNWVTNIVARVDPEAVQPIAVAPAATAVTPDSDLGFIITTITTLIAAALAAWAKWQERRKNKLNTVLGQNIETSLEVVEAQPNGKVLASKLKDELKSQQVDAGVKKMAAEVHDEKINTMDAKAAADRVME